VHWAMITSLESVTNVKSEDKATPNSKQAMRILACIMKRLFLLCLVTLLESGGKAEKLFHCHPRRALMSKIWVDCYTYHHFE
jgi:hypothetical protein